MSTPLKLTGNFVRYCGICKLALDRPGVPESLDCGGDCLRCMAEVGEDPDCIEELRKLRGGQS